VLAAGSEEDPGRRKKKSVERFEENPPPDTRFSNCQNHTDFILPSAATTVDNKIVMGVFNNPEQIKQFFRSNEGRQLYVDLHKQTAHERNGRRA
jgi:hypothetical protein